MRTARSTLLRTIPLALALAVLVAASAASAQDQPRSGTERRVEGAASASSDPSTSGALYDELARMDSTLFDATYVTCDTARLAALMMDDVEFYHDRMGLESGTKLRQSFQRLTQSCPRGQGITREVVAGSMHVYPIANYGAVQTGEHRFVERGVATMTVARFVHVWRRQGDVWKVARILSFDHQSVPR